MFETRTNDLVEMNAAVQEQIRHDRLLGTVDTTVSAGCSPPGWTRKEEKVDPDTLAKKLGAAIQQGRKWLMIGGMCSDIAFGAIAIAESQFPQVSVRYRRHDEDVAMLWFDAK